MDKKCFFIGHRDTPGNVRQLLIKAIDEHIVKYGVAEFYVGNHGSFDAMAAAALLERKKKYPHIQLNLSLAYHPSVRKVDIPKGFDGSFYPEGQELSPPRYAIPSLNRRMILYVEYLIAYVWMITDGSYNLLQYATAKEKRGQLLITNLANLPGHDGIHIAEQP